MVQHEDGLTHGSKLGRQRARGRVDDHHAEGARTSLHRLGGVVVRMVPKRASVVIARQGVPVRPARSGRHLGKGVVLIGRHMKTVHVEIRRARREAVGQMDDEFVAGREAQRWRGEAPIVTSHELRQVSCQAEAHLAELK
jgi:hypothetical protein